MTNPRLEIIDTRKKQLEGRCSCCHDVEFLATKELENRIYQELFLRYLFNLHFAKVHLGPVTQSL